MRTTLLTLALVACAGGGGADTAGGTPDPGGVPSGAQGGVFKGPFVKDSEVEYKMLDASGAETGEEGETYLDNNLGDYELEMPSQGYFRIEAEGAFFDEATGGKQEVPIKIESYVRIDPGETANAQVNILTHMIGERMFDELQGGGRTTRTPSCRSRRRCSTPSRSASAASPRAATTRRSRGARATSRPTSSR